jgi:hypothetical protein
MKTSNTLFIVALILITIVQSPVILFAQNKVIREIASFDQVKLADNLKVVF